MRVRPGLLLAMVVLRRRAAGPEELHPLDPAHVLAAQGGRTMAVRKKQLAVSLLLLLVGVVSGSSVGIATAVEVGAAAPEFKLPSTTGMDIALSDFKGKKWVFLEFYGADFVPV